MAEISFFSHDLSAALDFIGVDCLTKSVFGCMGNSIPVLLYIFESKIQLCTLNKWGVN